MYREVSAKAAQVPVNIVGNRLRQTRSPARTMRQALLYREMQKLERSER